MNLCAKLLMRSFQVLAGDWDSYQYLVESIRQFPPQEEFAQMIKDAGFRSKKAVCK